MITVPTPTPATVVAVVTRAATLADRLASLRAANAVLQSEVPKAEARDVADAKEAVSEGKSLPSAKHSVKVQQGLADNLREQSACAAVVADLDREAVEAIDAVRAEWVQQLRGLAVDKEEALAAAAAAFTRALAEHDYAQAAVRFVEEVIYEPPLRNDRGHVMVRQKWFDPRTPTASIEATLAVDSVIREEVLS